MDDTDMLDVPALLAWVKYAQKELMGLSRRIDGLVADLIRDYDDADNRLAALEGEAPDGPSTCASWCDRVRALEQAVIQLPYKEGMDELLDRLAALEATSHKHGETAAVNVGDDPFQYTPVYIPNMADGVPNHGRTVTTSGTSSTQPEVTFACTRCAELEEELEDAAMAHAKQELRIVNGYIVAIHKEPGGEWIGHCPTVRCCVQEKSKKRAFKAMEESIQDVLETLTYNDMELPTLDVPPCTRCAEYEQQIEEQGAKIEGLEAANEELTKDRDFYRRLTTPVTPWPTYVWPTIAHPSQWATKGPIVYRTTTHTNSGAEEETNAD